MTTPIPPDPCSPDFFARAVIGVVRLQRLLLWERSSTPEQTLAEETLVLSVSELGLKDPPPSTPCGEKP